MIMFYVFFCFHGAGVDFEKFEEIGRIVCSSSAGMKKLLHGVGNVGLVRFRAHVGSIFAA